MPRTVSPTCVFPHAFAPASPPTVFCHPVPTQVAILCNHQRAVAKTHDLQVAKLQSKLFELEEELVVLKAELRDATDAASKDK